jgi:hypothetical protein
LHDREQILFGGAAAAFSVKLTIDAAGIRDGVERAVKPRREMAQRFGPARDEMLAPLSVGLLAHSHNWESSASATSERITRLLEELDYELVQHPKESLDFLCIANLGFWWTVRVPFVPPPPDPIPSSTENQRLNGMAMTSIGQVDPTEIYTPVATLITHLLIRMSYVDTTLKPLATSLRAMGAVGSTNGPARLWDLDKVFSEVTQKQVKLEGWQPGYDMWGAVQF